MKRVASVPCMNHADNRTASGYNGQHEEAQSRRPASVRVPGHYHSAREDKSKQHEYLNPAKQTVDAWEKAAKRFIQKDQPVYQRERGGKNVRVEGNFVDADKCHFSSLKEEGLEIGWEVIGVVVQNC